MPVPCLVALLVPFVACLALLGVVPPAHADSTAPVLTGVRLVEAPQLGRNVFADVQGADAPEPGSGIRYVALSWERLDASGRSLGSVRAYGGGSGALTSSSTLGPWTASGRWTLVTATVTDQVGNQTTYQHDGTVTVSTGGAAPPPVDLSRADFDISNPNQDVSAPVVDSGGPLQPAVAVGQPLAVSMKVRDDRSRVTGATVSYVGPSGGRFSVTTGTGLGASGLASGVVPVGVEPGLWHADRISLDDFAGNHVWLDPAGASSFLPPGIAPFTPQPALDWAAFDVTVESDAPADKEPPVLESATLITPSSVRSGDSVEIDFTTTDATGTASVTFWFSDSDGHRVGVDGFCPARGKAVIALPQGLSLGSLSLVEAYAQDRLGNYVRYRPDGTTVTNDTTTGQHSLDLHALDMTVVAGQGSITVPRDTRDCRTFTATTATAPAAARKGTTVPVTGAVTLAGEPVAAGWVAIYRTDLGGAARLVQIVRTDAYGRYSGSLPLTAPTTVRTQFLGRDGALGSLSPNRVIRWSRGVSLTGATSVTGSSATFVSRVVPVVAGQRMLLQYRTSGGSFNTLAIGTTDAQGYARFRVSVPLGTRTYRATAQLTPAWAIATSPWLTQRRTS